MGPFFIICFRDWVYVKGTISECSDSKFKAGLFASQAVFATHFGRDYSEYGPVSAGRPWCVCHDIISRSLSRWDEKPIVIEDY